MLLFQNRWDGNFTFHTRTLHASFLFDNNFIDNYNEANFKILINKDYCKHSYEILEVLGFTKYIYFMETMFIFVII